MVDMKVPIFDPGCSVSAFLERLECYFSLHEVKGDKRVQILIVGLAPEQYDILRDILAPAKPKDASYKVVTEALVGYFDKPRHWMVERQNFRDMKQLSGEEVAEFAGRLKNQARYCDFGADLNINLTEQLLRGLVNKDIKAGLLEETDAVLKDFSSLLRLANMRDQLAVVKQEPVATGVVAAVRGEERCGKCGKLHQKGYCPAKDRKCYKCGEKGHFSNKCEKTIQMVTAPEYSDSDDLLY